MKPVFRSDVVVELRQHTGSDLSICKSAWVSSGKEPEKSTDARVKGLVNALVRDKHNSPLESGFMEFYVEAPRGVRDEVFRHRSLSFSSSSLRYTESPPEFYVPPRDRAIAKAEGFKQIRPVFETLSDEDYLVYTDALKRAYESSWTFYQAIRKVRPETEALRWITTDGLYTRFYVRCNPRTLMQFLQLRTYRPDANHPSYPMEEIAWVAEKMETIFAELFPFTYESWNDFGRDV